MGDLKSFETFVTDYQDMVFATAYRLTGQAADAEDVSQDAFLKAYAHWDTLRHSERAGGWLKKVTTHLAINHLTRYRARWTFFSELNEEPVTADPLPEDELNNPVILDRLEHSLAQLAPHWRVPLVLFYLEGYSNKEISILLGISEAKTKSDIHRARAALRRLMTHPGPSGGSRAVERIPLGDASHFRQLVQILRGPAASAHGGGI